MKTLLTTTALVGAVAFAGAAVAGGDTGMGSNLSVTVGGFADFQAGFMDQDNTLANSQDNGFQNDTEIHVKVEGSTDNGLKYGAVIELEADVNADDKGEGGNADKTYIFVESSAGRVELGATSSVAETMRVDAASIARATGGIDGDFIDYLLVPATDTFVTTSDFIIEAAGATEDANKISYYTPRFSGVQVGVSYTPDSGQTGTSTGINAVGAVGGFNDVITVGVNYEGEIEGVALAVAATAVNGEAQVATEEDTSSWQVGASAAFEGFSVAASYTDVGEIGTIASNTDADLWTLGAAYETGPYGVSVTYLDSEVSAAGLDSEFTNLVVGADYQLAPGLVPYVEVSFFELDGSTAGAANDNDGSVIIIGTQLTF